MQNAEKEIGKTPRNCKDCGASVGKSKQLCEECRVERRKAREKINCAKLRKLPKGEWSVMANFKRDDQGKVTEKLCTGCKEWLKADQFNKRKDTASGLVSTCKACYKIKNRGYAKKSYNKRRNQPIFLSVIKFCAGDDCGKSFAPKGPRVFCSEECSRIKSRDNQREKKGSLRATEFFTCKRCNKTKHLDLFKEGIKIAPWVCVECSEKSRKKNVIQSRRSRRKNPKYRARENAKRRFQETMRFIKQGRKGSFRSLIGCSPSALAAHLESRFKRGMKWSNYGTHWHVDHILPVASFDHRDPEQVKRCWHFSNLQPLKAQENLNKGDSIIDCQPELLLQLVDS